MKPAESYLGQPIRSLQTMLRVIAENDSRYDTLIPDGIYGPATAAAVSKFQRIHGLPPTGVADQYTWEQIVAAHELALIQVDEAEALRIILNPGQIIRPGERHPNLRIAQAILTVLSELYESISPPSGTGILDEPTQESLASFQRLNNLPATGYLDKQTWKHLALQYPLGANLLDRG